MKQFLKFIANITVFPLYAAVGRLLKNCYAGQHRLLAPKSFDRFLMDRCDSDESGKEPLEELIRNLKQNLDAESRAAVDRYLMRVITAVMCNKMNVYCTPAAWLRLSNQQEKEEVRRLSEIKYPFTVTKYIALTDNGITYLPRQVQQQLEGKDFIDGGAFIGDSLPCLIKYHPKRIFAFEPDENNRKKLLQNCQRFDWQQVIPVGKGLGKSNTYGSIISKQSASLVHDNGSGGIKIVDIDSFCTENKLNCGLIKLDVEGMESDVIHGAVETIKTQKPVLLISIYHNPNDFFRIKPFIENLNLGYTFLIRKLAPQAAFSETMLIAYTDTP